MLFSYNLLRTLLDTMSHSYANMKVNILDTFNFSTEEVQEKLQHLNINKSTGPDNYASALEDKLARPLTHIFNNSVETGIIPEDWKSKNVTAIHKKGSRQEPRN